ncbi:hypothetical protein QYE76_069933 [Lolium multiflorum]|uniref:Uncharacterized protein n=1 Tax=Lolium multiflorum TaxID=4521 RepID=A0AAD8WDG6_LOLMU|nr:hypothetical protein QYE76_069933 [Lolium multiflorum]
MASRAAAALRTAALQGYRRSASTAAAQADGGAARAKAKPVGDYVRAHLRGAGMIGLAATLGLHTARQQLAQAPNVRLDKRKRETVAEVADPARTSPSTMPSVSARKAATLKDVGMEPPGIPGQGREGVLDRIFKKNTT